MEYPFEVEKEAAEILIEGIRRFRNSHPELSEYRKDALTRVANALTHWPSSEDTDLQIFADSVFNVQATDGY